MFVVYNRLVYEFDCQTGVNNIILYTENNSKWLQALKHVCQLEQVQLTLHNQAKEPYGTLGTFSAVSNKNVLH